MATQAVGVAGPCAAQASPRRQLGLALNEATSAQLPNRRGRSSAAWTPRPEGRPGFRPHVAGDVPGPAG